jgi:hypothetical protein
LLGLLDKPETCQQLSMTNLHIFAHNSYHHPTWGQGMTIPHMRQEWLI